MRRLAESDGRGTGLPRLARACVRTRNRDASSIDLALAASEHVDVLLLDSGNPAAKVRELGGTGRVHDWSISRRSVERATIPVFLAGGLNASNVGEAIRAVRRFGIDLCSGVRTDGGLGRGDGIERDEPDSVPSSAIPPLTVL